ncbi:unnamed protein product [Clonostachys solani]|uniref:Enoyl-CoA delta isomerase 3 n=1 Tax=Clonostachys solani TaxID=160281 RepID=A0A9N9YWI9_9HYPO|nr:unnamed protein product [Clonostachys solani]
MEPLFTIPIAALPPNHPGGEIVCTTPRPRTYVLTFSSPPDNRMTTPFCRALLSALDVLEFGDHESGVVITTSAIPKFYSNGLDLEHAVATDGFWALLYEVWRRFLTFPMPTIALLNGHAFAGGLMLAMAHDYRLAPHPKGFLCVNELLFGAPLKPAMAAIFRTKLTPQVYRNLVLEARRFTGADAVEAGIADGLADEGVESALKFIDARGIEDKGKTGVYGVIKAEMYKDLVRMLKGPGLEAEDARFDAAQENERERKEFGKVWYEQWQRENQKAKL